MQRLVIALVLISGLTSMRSCLAMAAGDDGLAAELSEIVSRQARMWNAGNIDGFMQPYWKSEDLTFSSGGSTTRGWEATRSRYKKRYPNREVMGTLAFTDLEIRQLSDASAIMLGRWRLTREDPIEGNFTLVWQRIDNQWFIVHDHTSSSPEIEANTKPGPTQPATTAPNP